MTPPPSAQPIPVEAFCLHCGLIQSGLLYGGTFRWGRWREQTVIVHCEGCSEVSRHIGDVVIHGANGRMTVING